MKVISQCWRVGRSWLSGSRTSRPADGRMPFMDHIRELRSRLIKSVLVILVCAVIFYFAFYERVIDFLITPTCGLDVSGVGNNPQCSAPVISGLLSAFSLKLKFSLAGGLLLASPVWLYQVWAFIAPGLHQREKRYTVAFVAAGVPLFCSGAGLFYLILPRALNVLASFVPGKASFQLLLDDYLTVLLRMVLVFGFAFELPLVLVLLNIGGVLSAARMAGWWRWMVLGIFVFGAVATPTGDPGTMTLLAIPVCLLYLAAVILAKLNDRRRGRRAAADPNAQLSDDEASIIDPRPSPLDEDDDR